MKLPKIPLSRPLPVTFRTAALALLPFAASAESIVFKADFSGTANTVTLTPSVITPAGATWYGAYNKANGALTVDADGVKITGNASSSAAINVAGRVTQTPINLVNDGDFIEFSGSFFTDNLQNVCFGLYNSGGQDPLDNLLNNGLANTGVAPGGGTFGWKGYRAMSLSGSLNADFKARQSQTERVATGTKSYADYELFSPGTGGFASPGSIGTGSAVNSPTAIDWNSTDGLVQYDFTYRITRSGADALAFSHTIKNPTTSAVLYTASGATTAVSQPSTITSSFDAIAWGGRVNNSVAPVVRLSAIKVTASNADIVKIATQPVAKSIVVGGSDNLTVAATGAGTLSYQWFKDGVAIEGATSATYAFTNANAGQSGQYHVVVSNAVGYETSATVTVNVSAPTIPVITTEPVSKAVDAGTALTLTVAATAVPTPTYQWYRNNTLIPGATSATYTVATATTADAGTYKVIVTNSVGSDTSANAVVTITTAAPAITTQPSPVTVNVGQAVNLSAAASGLPAPTYQWYLGGQAIDGATASTYTIASATTALAGNYTVTATNPFGSATSNVALVTVNVVLPTLVIEPPAALTVHQGKRITINATYAGSTPRTYQWFKGTEPIAGATGTSYTIASATAADAGAYHVVVTNEGGDKASQDTLLSVVGLSQTTKFSTNFALDTKNNPGTPITENSTNWFIMATRDATNSTVGDDPATTEVVETNPLKLTWVGTAGSALVETAARFTETPVALAAVGDSVNLRATLSGTNLRSICFGLFNSHQENARVLDSSDGGALMVSTNTSAVGAGTQLWSGYRSSLTIGSSGGDIGTRPVQDKPGDGIGSNRMQELLFPAGSTGAAFGEPAGVSAGVVPGVGGTIALNDGAVYTLDYTISLSAANQYTITYSLYDGASAGGTLLYSSNATTTATGALPSDVATTFDALAIGLRNNNDATSPTLTITSLAVTKGTASAITESAYSTWAADQHLTPGLNDGVAQDPDFDGINNLLEFVLGGNPLAASNSILPVFTKNGGSSTFSFNVQTAATADYAISAESSTNLTTWTPAVHGVGGVTIVQTPVNATTNHVVVTLPTAGTNTFVRLRVAAKN